MTAAEFYEDVTAAGLIGLGLNYGDAIAIMSRTRYSGRSRLAAWTRLLPVPIYKNPRANRLNTSSKMQTSVPL